MSEQDRRLRVTIDHAPDSTVTECMRSLGDIAGFSVRVEDRFGAVEHKGLTWEEMVGQVLSIFPSPRRPRFTHHVKLNRPEAAQ